MQSQTNKQLVQIATTEQGLEVHLMTDLDMLLAVLNNCDRWTEIEGSFLCVRGSMTGLFTWVGKLAQAEAAS